MWWALKQYVSGHGNRPARSTASSLIRPGSIILLLGVNMSIAKWILHFHGSWLSQQLLWGWIAMRLNRDCTCPVLVKTSSLWVSPHVFHSVSSLMSQAQWDRLPWNYGHSCAGCPGDTSQWPWWSFDLSCADGSIFYFFLFWRKQKQWKLIERRINLNHSGEPLTSFYCNSNRLTFFNYACWHRRSGNVSMLALAFRLSNTALWHRYVVWSVSTMSMSDIIELNCLEHSCCEQLFSFRCVFWSVSVQFLSFLVNPELRVKAPVAAVISIASWAVLTTKRSQWWVFFFLFWLLFLCNHFKFEGLGVEWPLVSSGELWVEHLREGFLLVLLLLLLFSGLDNSLKCFILAYHK